MSQCPADIRLWCAPKTSGVAGLTLQELATALLPFLPSTFLGLSDTPSSYAGSGGLNVVVNGAANALEFSAAASAGKLVQAIQGTDIQTLTTTNIILLDDTIPQQTEGTEIVTATITPSAADSTLYCFFTALLYADSATSPTFALFRDAGADALYATSHRCEGNTVQTVAFAATAVSAGATAATTFKVRFGPNSSTTIRVNSFGMNRLFGGVSATTLTVLEVAA